jgi:ketosteroid isomerase-like protein
LQGNAAIAEGNHEGFLQFCTDDTEWNFVGERILKGKQAVREYMAKTYVEPPRFTIAHLIAEGDFLTVVGEIILKDENGTPVRYAYCDVWRFREDKIVELNAFVIKMDGSV